MRLKTLDQHPAGSESGSVLSPDPLSTGVNPRPGDELQSVLHHQLAGSSPDSPGLDTVPAQDSRWLEGSHGVGETRHGPAVQGASFLPAGAHPALVGDKAIVG